MDSEVLRHYEDLLARRYTWLLGGTFDEQVTVQRIALEHAIPHGDRRGVALDLGCGSGAAAVALAGLGFDPVVAVDASPTLVAEVEQRTASVGAVQPRLADFAAGLDDVAPPATVAAVTCLGDTLSHLADRAAVTSALGAMFDVLEPGGWCVLSLRDLTGVLTDTARFMQVQADDTAILTCFLEDEPPDHVGVNDLLHTRGPDGRWALQVSRYSKVRTGPAWVSDQLSDAGFVDVQTTSGERGLWWVTARRPE